MTLQRVKTPLGEVRGGRRPPLPWALGLPPGSRWGAGTDTPFSEPPPATGTAYLSHVGVPKPEWGGGWEQPDTPCQPPPARSGVGLLDLAYFQREKKGRGDKLHGGEGCVCA